MTDTHSCEKSIRAFLAPVAVFLAALSFAVTSTSSPADAKISAGGPVVALGDSFISGIGAGTYTHTGRCRQSLRSYPRQLAIRMGRSAIDLSCPGATIPEVSYRVDSIPRNAALVLIQIGGNDIGFVRLAGTCIIAGRATCHESIAQARRTLNTIEPSLVALLRSLRAQAPRARIVMMGYPQMLGTPAQCSHIMPADRVWALRALQKRLDRTLERSAADARTQFLDWPILVDRHSLCAEAPWYGLPGDRLDDVLHPDLRAHGAVADRLWRRLQ
jgi:lysophospholipase L1-like esterase